MIKLRYQKENIKFQNKKLDSSSISTWNDLKSHISSLSSKSNPLTFIHILEGQKVIVTDSGLDGKEIIEWSNVNVTLWNAVKTEIEAL